MTLPNILTLIRIALMPILVLMFYLPIPYTGWICAIIFTIAGVTDYFDGYLARRLKQTSSFGRFFDPVADKLIVAIALVMLIEEHATPLFAIPAMIIICREIVVSALREWMAEVGARMTVAVSTIGKFKAGFQMTAIGFLLLAHKPIDGRIYINGLGYILLYLACILTIWSMVIYLRAAWPSLDFSKDKNQD